MAAAEGISRDAFLASAGQLAEEVVEVEGIGKVLVRELTGEARAKVLGVLAPAASGGTIDFGRYQEMLLQLGLIDPADGQPMLDMASVKQAMQLGGSKIEQLCSAVERLSGLDKGAKERAEKNSPTAPSSSTTSG